MFLEKLEIQGFKSFPGRNQLVFSGFVEDQKRGITAIVGPNGSGKSNIADAIRWVLGEQSMKNLRAKDARDVIFSGTGQHSKNMAEVSLYLNNNKKQVDIPYSELTLTRRAYKSGENEYLINNSRARLSDIQMILARSNFGQKTYSVIGQGMVEHFLKTTPKERKDFFDEATGVKEFQIKRENSINKLANSKKNLDQVDLILNEITPRLRSLTRQVNKLKKKKDLEKRLSALNFDHYRGRWHHLNQRFERYNNELLSLKKQKEVKKEKLQELETKFKEKREKGGISNDFANISNSLSNYEEKRVELIKRSTEIKTQMELKLEYSGDFDMAWITKRIDAIDGELNDLKKRENESEERIVRAKNDMEEAKKKKEKIFSQIETMERELFRANQETKKGKDEGEIRSHLKEMNSLLNEALQIDSFEKAKEKLSIVQKGLRKLLEMIKGEEVAENGGREELSGLREELRRIEDEFGRASLDFNIHTEKKRSAEAEISKLSKERSDIERKKEKYDNSRGSNEAKKMEEEKRSVLREIEGIDKKMDGLRKELNDLRQAEQREKEELGGLQKDISRIQSEISDLDRKINDVNTNSIKYETRLEDLERDIRANNDLDLYKIKNSDSVLSEEVDEEDNRYEAAKIKKELELIGGIDKETEQEYNKTKGKYDFLEAQSSDLKGGIKKLEGIIKQLDADIKTKFDKEFKRIAKKFEEYFKILFGGGRAEIVPISAKEEGLEEGDGDQDPFITGSATGIAGIDIKANPPGKRIQSLSLLSGGEKALTAIALICAIINNNPAPFVTLDEVDAALDEANSERLARILEDLSYKTQFIVITHNRSSMNRANILYGTTMDDKGVSKLLSVKLDK